MTPSLWIETVSSPHLAWPGGALLEPFTPIEVTHPIRFGPRGSGAELVWAEPHELELSPGPGGVFLRLTPGNPKPTLVKVGSVCGNHPLQLRVMNAAHDSAGWPAELARPSGPWPDETLSVLADQLLERGCSVGQRFLTRDPQTDDSWLPVLAGERRADGTVSWRRGVVDELMLSVWPSWEFGRTLARQAVCAPVRQLELSFMGSAEHSAVVSGLIAGGGFPCLELFRITASRGPQTMSSSASPELAERLRKLPGFGDSFPALRSFEVEREIPSPRVYPVVG